jgi:uncharacterized protein
VDGLSWHPIDQEVGIEIGNRKDVQLGFALSYGTVRYCEVKVSQLHAAAYNGNVDIVLRLLADGTQPDVRDEKGYTALLWASFRAAVTDQVPVIRALIQAGADPNAATNAGDANCLIFAAQSGNEPAVAALIAGGADVNARADGVTALMVAARCGETGIVGLLLQSGADPTIRCGRFSAADYASYSGHDELATLLNDAGPRSPR